MASVLQETVIIVILELDTVSLVFCHISYFYFCIFIKVRFILLFVYLMTSDV